MEKIKTDLLEKEPTPEVRELVAELESEKAVVAERIDTEVVSLLQGLDANKEQDALLIKDIESFQSKAQSKLQSFVNVSALFLAVLAFNQSEKPRETSFEDKRQRASKEMHEKGITWEQKQAYITGVNDLLYRAIIPRGYDDSSGTSWSNDFEAMKDIANRFIEGLSREKKDDDTFDGARQDAWRLYLGISQKNNTFDVSEYKPKISKEDKYYFKVNNIESLFPTAYDGIKKENIQALVKYIESNDGKIIQYDRGIMGSYTWSTGEDEKGSYISYYDKWDLNVPLERDGGFFGSPFEIYDRIYYDPVTFEPR